LSQPYRAYYYKFLQKAYQFHADYNLRFDQMKPIKTRKSGQGCR